MAAGTLPSVLPAVFGLFPVWSFDWSSAFLPLSLSPLELASAFASLEASVAALTVKDFAVRLRSRSAVDFVSTMLIETAAPMATSLPPASPLESALEPVSSLA